MKYFSHLAPQSRIWIYQADRALTSIESAEIGNKLNDLVSHWLTHKAKVAGDGLVLHERFIILAADEAALQVSGCSIDSTVRWIKEIANQCELNFFDRFYTCFVEDGRVIGCDFDSFKKLHKEGSITDNTLVYNNLITRLTDLDTKWLVPLHSSWHSRYLNSVASVSSHL